MKQYKIHPFIKEESNRPNVGIVMRHTLNRQSATTWRTGKRHRGASRANWKVASMPPWSFLMMSRLPTTGKAPTSTSWTRKPTNPAYPFYPSSRWKGSAYNVNWSCRREAVWDGQNKAWLLWILHKWSTGGCSSKDESFQQCVFISCFGGYSLMWIYSSDTDKNTGSGDNTWSVKEEILCKISEGFIKEGKREGKLEVILSVMKSRIGT